MLLERWIRFFTKGREDAGRAPPRNGLPDEADAMRAAEEQRFVEAATTISLFAALTAAEPFEQDDPPAADQSVDPIEF